VDENGKNTRSKETGHIQIELSEYAKNMEAIVKRLKKTGAALIFATTTPYPDKPAGPLREAFQPARYNGVAVQIMKNHDVPVNDLYMFTIHRLKELQQPNNVHFTKQGSVELAKEVKKHIMKAIN
jgi:lysophospholipase L1-like esterase